MFGKRRAFRRLAKEEAARVKPVVEEAAAAIDAATEEIETELRRFPELLCPKCGSPMIKRIARRGRYAGSEFWGCSRWPSCSSVRTYRRSRR